MTYSRIIRIKDIYILFVFSLVPVVQGYKQTVYMSFSTFSIGGIYLMLIIGHYLKLPSRSRAALACKLLTYNQIQGSRSPRCRTPYTRRGCVPQWEDGQQSFGGYPRAGTPWCTAETWEAWSRLRTKWLKTISPTFCRWYNKMFVFGRSFFLSLCLLWWIQSITY